RGQLVISNGQTITAADYEALNQLGLLRPVDKRLQETVRAGLGSIITMVMMGLYVSRFRPSLLYNEPRLITLLAVIFLITLGAARVALNGEFYIYPAAALALIYVALVGHQIAFIGVVGLAFLIGLMTGSTFENAALVLIGGIIGALALRRSERLNSFFFAGMMVFVGYVSVAISFVITSTDPNRVSELLLLIVYSLVNGILTAAATIAAMYIITLVFNLPTALKMIELSQPNQPLLQRLLREAPGTYQHSLQVANLCDQAANAIGADAQLIHVAALYHDIGKMLNPSFFTENQGEMGNPHDALNDPYRSAEIIISHVTGGDELGKQYRLPNRIRDFIREHHGTQEVYVFYQQALALADGDASQVDKNDFRYPGPKPQTRETAIMMLADGAEASVRARQPKSKSEIDDMVREVIEARRKSGQLDESNLTLNDLKTIEKIFVEMLQAVFHPRINYAEAVARVRKPTPTPTSTPPVEAPKPVPKEPSVDKRTTTGEVPTVVTPKSTTSIPKVTLPLADDDDDAPIPEVPRLKKAEDNGKASTEKKEEKPTDEPR
ncbi:MAG: HDIG domain-containing protein, partial [Anaerolineae bacterium]|nr:HDIG domain-containing protein [Anaerolineae bacterium]